LLLTNQGPDNLSPERGTIDLPQPLSGIRNIRHSAKRDTIIKRGSQQDRQSSVSGTERLATFEAPNGIKPGVAAGHWDKNSLEIP
jgi:hypothetical protein